MGTRVSSKNSRIISSVKGSMPVSRSSILSYQPRLIRASSMVQKPSAMDVVIISIQPGVMMAVRFSCRLRALSGPRKISMQFCSAGNAPRQLSAMWLMGCWAWHLVIYGTRSCSRPRARNHGDVFPTWPVNPAVPSADNSARRPPGQGCLLPRSCRLPVRAQMTQIPFFSPDMYLINTLTFRFPCPQDINFSRKLKPTMTRHWGISATVILEVMANKKPTLY